MIPSSGVVGTQVTLSIAAVDSSMRGQYVITWNDTPVVDQGAPIILSKGYLSNGNGGFSAQVIIPESPAGNYFVCFQPESGTGRTNFQFNLQPDFGINPSMAKPGESITLKGTGFPANQRVAIYLNGVTMDINVIANMKGSFYQSVKIPVLDAGYYKLIASNENSAINKSVTMQVLPVKIVTEENEPDPSKEIPVVPQVFPDTLAPQMPVPQSPMGNKIGYIGNQPVTFKWSDVSDESGVRYALEVCKDSEAAQIVLKVKDLPANFYAALIEPGTYYWRVKAIDGNGNESDWRFATYSFQVSEVSILWAEFLDFVERTKIFIILLWIIGIYILTSLVIFLVRKMKTK